MAQNTPWHIFSKYFQNKATSEEQQEIGAWMNADPEHKAILNEAYHVFNVSKRPPSILYPDTKKAWKKVDKVTSSHIKNTNPNIRYALAVAAAIVFGLMILGVVNSYIRDYQLDSQYSEIFTQPGQRTNVRLPDGTLVWLNSGSMLKYPSSFNGKEREVVLTGEAYFEVEKDKSKKFTVKGEGLYVEVFGTSFNVKNYPDEEIQEVTVAEGVVGVSDGSFNTHLLSKNDQAIYNKEHREIRYGKEDPSLVSAWKNNELVFKNTPIEEAVSALESWYGVRITLDEEMIGGHSYTFKVKTESLKEVLDMMKVMTPFRYKIDGKEVELNYVTKQ